MLGTTRCAISSSAASLAASRRSWKIQGPWHGDLRQHSVRSGGRGVIDEEEAVKNADSQNNLRLKIKLWREKGQIGNSAAASGWSLEPTKDEGDLF